MQVAYESVCKNAGFPADRRLPLSPIVGGPKDQGSRCAVLVSVKIWPLFSKYLYILSVVRKCMFVVVWRSITPQLLNWFWWNLKWRLNIRRINTSMFYSGESHGICENPKIISFRRSPAVDIRLDLSRSRNFLDLFLTGIFEVAKG